MKLLGLIIASMLDTQKRWFLPAKPGKCGGDHESWNPVWPAKSQD